VTEPVGDEVSGAPLLFVARFLVMRLSCRRRLAIRCCSVLRWAGA
jgi:hypothetical protein